MIVTIILVSMELRSVMLISAGSILKILIFMELWVEKQIFGKAAS
jgi:hypothetical protein